MAAGGDGCGAGVAKSARPGTCKASRKAKEKEKEKEKEKAKTGAAVAGVAGVAGTKPAGKPGAKVQEPTAAERRATFLAVLARTANVSRAARAAGMASSTLYGMRGRSQAFAREWDAAIAEALDMVEETLIDRAVNGVEKPIFYGGEQKGTVRVYSDQLAMFLLRARRPEVYDRVVKAGQSPDEMSEEEARAEYRRRISRVRGEEDAA